MVKQSVAIELIEREHSKAVMRFGKFHSAHEGLGIIREEYLELEKEIFKKQSEYNLNQMRQEAIQLGAMALRFIIDIT